MPAPNMLVVLQKTATIQGGFHGRAFQKRGARNRWQESLRCPFYLCCLFRERIPQLGPSCVGIGCRTAIVGQGITAGSRATCRSMQTEASRESTNLDVCGVISRKLPIIGTAEWTL